MKRGTLTKREARAMLAARQRRLGKNDPDRPIPNPIKDLYTKAMALKSAGKRDR